MDFALAWNATTFSADWTIDTTAMDLAADDGLQSAVIISLFTDRRAAVDDVLPDGSNDRRGWWGDAPVDGTAAAADDDLIGSRLWLLSRAKAIPATARLAEAYCLEALNWMVTDGIAADIQVTAQWIAADKLGLRVEIARYVPGAANDNRRFDFLWNAALAA